MWGWYGRGGWTGPWPGRGPFSYLPPWQRPGWVFGRGACWWLFNPWLRPWWGPTPTYPYTPGYYYYPWYAYPWYAYYPYTW